MYTCSTLEKFCEKSGPFFRGICPGRWNLLDFQVFFNKIQSNSKDLDSRPARPSSGRAGWLQISSKSFIQICWDSGRSSAGARPSSGELRPRPQMPAGGQPGSKISFLTDDPRSRTCRHGDPIFFPYFPTVVKSRPGDRFRRVHGPRRNLRQR